MVRLIAGTQEALSLAGGKGQEAPATPKWITPMLLFIDLYEKVSSVVPARLFFKTWLGKPDLPSIICSVADPGCLSWFLSILDLGSRFSDSGFNNSTKRGGGKSFFYPTIFFSHKYKIVNNFIIEQEKKTFVAKTLSFSLS
jgi:hypothetical protein